MPQAQLQPTYQGEANVAPNLLTLPQLTEDEDAFAVAMVERGGNYRAAYFDVFGEDALSPVANANVLMNRPHVAARIRTLAVALRDNEIVNKADHAFRLAEIRDNALGAGQFKVAKECEMARGQLMGWYEKAVETKQPEALTVLVSIGGNVMTVEQHKMAPKPEAVTEVIEMDAK